MIDWSNDTIKVGGITFKKLGQPYDRVKRYIANDGSLFVTKRTLTSVIGESIPRGSTGKLYMDVDFHRVTPATMKNNKDKVGIKFLFTDTRKNTFIDDHGYVLIYGRTLKQI